MDAIIAGHVCLDVFPDLTALTPGQFDSSFQPGRLIKSGPVHLTAGGAVSNTGLALNLLDIKTRLIGRIGNDLFGSALRQILADHGTDLDKSLFIGTESSTSYSIVINPPGSDRRFLHHSGANDDFCAQDVSDESLHDARLFHFGYPPLMAGMYSNAGQQLLELFQRVKAFGLTTSLDMAFPGPESDASRADWLTILKKVLPYVDVFVPSLDEVLFMLWKRTDLPLSADLLTKVGEELMRLGAKMVLLKLGNRGLYLRTGSTAILKDLGLAAPEDIQAWANFEAWAPCFQVDVMGTTGAGDVTVAGFLAALLRSLLPEEALTAALAVGACSVEAPDALSGIRSWSATWQRIKAGWVRRPEPEQFSRRY
jgi:sugar/nucleoside kinase (ribokinase family)